MGKERFLFNPISRWFFMQVANRRFYSALIERNPDNRLKAVQEDKYDMIKALLYRISLGFERGDISRVPAAKLVSLINNTFLGKRREEFVERYGYFPPMFFTISPYKGCNLRCIGCYADSDASQNKLPYPALDRIIGDAKSSWGANFFVISGGEPLMYRSEDKSRETKTIVDIAAKHEDCFFLMYTNGTLINEEMAEQLAAVGNITPAISVEGMEKETKERRGLGVFKKVDKAMENLKYVGVPFGISVTVTKKNADVITSDEFLNYYFDEQGAIYAWIFHYMPIGREFTLELLPTPEQRVNMLRKEKEIVRERKIFLADFWNSGTISDGCISGARPRGYFYINWDGDVMPCVFAPYSLHNILEVYANGGSLEDVINSPLFRRIRDWQNKYSYEQPSEETGNLLRQCPVRDHYKEFHQIITETGAKPIDENARLALEDEEYRKGLIEYGERIGKLTQAIWEENYLSRG